MIAEDLGVRDPLLEELLRKTGLPGMRVLQFAFLGQDDGIHLPHNYLPNTVAYTGTHDNNTLLGFLWEITPKERAYCLGLLRLSRRRLEGRRRRQSRNPLDSQNALGLAGQAGNGAGAGSAGLWRRYKNESSRVAEGNWEFRLTEEAFTRLDPSVYQHLSDLYNR